MEGKAELTEEIKRVAVASGAFKVGVADAVNGFEKAVDGCHPRDLMPECRSAVCTDVFVGNGYYEWRGLRTHDDGRPFGRVAGWLCDSVTLAVVQLLQRRGVRAYVAPNTLRGDDAAKSRSPLKLGEDAVVPFSMKLAAYEAGLGAYGRNSTIVTPEHGSQVYFSVVLTDAELEYDRPLERFDPCEGCAVCSDLCPAGAIDASVEPPRSHDRVRCKSFVFSLPDHSTDPVLTRCGLCTDRCPRADLDAFTVHRHYTLLDVPEDAAESIQRAVLESEEYERRLEEFGSWDGNRGLRE